MSESTADNGRTGNPEDAPVPGTTEEPGTGGRRDDVTGAVPAPGQDPEDDPDAEGEERFDAG